MCLGLSARFIRRSIRIVVAWSPWLAMSGGAWRQRCAWAGMREHSRARGRRCVEAAVRVGGDARTQPCARPLRSSGCVCTRIAVRFRYGSGGVGAEPNSVGRTAHSPQKSSNVRCKSCCLGWAGVTTDPVLQRRNPRPIPGDRAGEWRVARVEAGLHAKDWSGP